MLHQRVTLPTGVPLDVYAPASPVDPDQRRRGIIICPGGGYTHLSMREAEPVALRFTGMGFVTFVAGCLYYHRQKNKISYAALPVVVTVAVAVAGMVEWIYHLSNPCGFMLMMVITPLLFKNEK